MIFRRSLRLFSSMRRYSLSNRSAGISDKHILSYSKQVHAVPNKSLNSTVMEDIKKDFVLPNDQKVVELDASIAFKNLTKQEKLYAHYLSQAAWSGGLIVLIQTSPESPLIFSLLHRIFFNESVEDLKESAVKHDVSENDFMAFLVYAGGVFANMGNYKGFGDTKFVPNLTEDSFELIVKASKVFRDDPVKITKLLRNASKRLFSLEPRVRSLGFKDKGITTYFSANCSKEDAEFVNDWLKMKKMEAYICRTFKTHHKDGLPIYTIHLASVEESPKPPLTMGLEKFKNAYFQITRGDYYLLLKKVNSYLIKAMDHAANHNEKEMLKHYINSFKEGDLNEHKDGSRFWIKDKGPVIETYQGFIETYRDPAGMRGEFEGFVAMVNKEMSAKFGALVENAESFISHLPWGKDLEKDHFFRPDFTSLDVLTFSGSGIPSGINIPNYDEIRQDEGFKNVSLGNVIPASYKDSVMPFLSDEDRKLLQTYRVQAFEVQVGLHELLGHGSGKLFRQNADGTFNFDKEKVKNPVTGGEIKSWYCEGDTYDSKFTTLGSAFEECRAEAVGLYLSLEPDVLKIFGFEGEEAKKVTYTNWLSLLWNGAAKATEMYQPSTDSWLQAHARARFVLMRLLELEGDGMLKIEETEPKTNLKITLNKDLLHTKGKEVIGKFLTKLQTLKATGDAKGAEELFARYSRLDAPWNEWRDIVLLHKQPRNIFVQPNTRHVGDDVELITYPSTVEGLIKSWSDRFSDTKIDDALELLAEIDKKYFEELTHVE